jgi:hypothetical protein
MIGHPHHADNYKIMPPILTSLPVFNTHFRLKVDFFTSNSPFLIIFYLCRCQHNAPIIMAKNKNMEKESRRHLELLAILPFPSPRPKTAPT